MEYEGSSPSAVIPLVGSQLTYQLGGGVVLPSPRGITSAPTIHATRITTLTSVERRGSNVLRAKPKLLTRIVAGKTLPTQRSSTAPIWGKGQSATLRCHRP